MKFSLTAILVFVAFVAKTQDRELVNCSGFSTCFSGMKVGVFDGQISGILKITTVKGESISFSFKSDQSSLSIIPDINEVYDISNKIYQAESADRRLKLEYKTYALANFLQIRLDNESFQLGGIDGGCDLIISGLKYEYKAAPTVGNLSLNFVKDVGLRMGRKCQSPILVVCKGSLSNFDILRK